jgi:hypothetical protein
MKICKAIKTCRKLAKAALPDIAPTRGGVLRTAKALLDRFDDELAARSEVTSIRQAAAAIVAAGRVRRNAAQELEVLADVAARYLTHRADAKKDETSAVAIVRALAWNIRAVRPSRRARAAVGASLQVA